MSGIFVLGSEPVSAAHHSGTMGHRGGTAATMLTVYLVLLVAIPSNVTIGALGSLGRPAMLWGLVLLFWWVLSRLQLREHQLRPVTQPVRAAFAAIFVLALISLAAALFRGQPVDQVSPAVTALVRLASWGGVLLVAVEGIRTPVDAARMVRRIAVAGGLLGALGLAQFVTGQTLLDWVSSVPGLSVESGGVVARGSFTRASGTAAHPLEFGTAIIASLPLAITVAVSSGFRPSRSWKSFLWWLPVALIVVCALVAVSRSAIIGLAVAVLASLPAIPKAYRAVVLGAGAAVSAVVFVIVPGMLTTIISLFAGASDDPSTQSRTNALARLPEFVASSPWIGQGFGTFLPRYYIFDNEWVLVMVELGILGTLAFAAFIVCAIGSAGWAYRHSTFADTRAISLSLIASMLTIAVLFIFFDGLAFPISAGYFFLIAGLTGAMRTIASADDVMTLSITRAARAETRSVSNGR